MFSSLEEMIDHFKNCDLIDGIVEYGSNHFYESENIKGDYDLTIITKEKVFNSLSGVHFHVNGIPVDCMIKSVSDFDIEKPTNKFDYVHLDSTILFDRRGNIKKIIEIINEKWKMESELSEREKSKFRFRFSHFVDKLINRIDEKDYFLFNSHTMSVAITQSLECYCRINNLPLGKTFLYFEHMKDNNLLLYTLFLKYYKENDIKKRFEILKSIFKELLKDIGGFWKENEIIYHGITDCIPNQEIEIIKSIL